MFGRVVVEAEMVVQLLLTHGANDITRAHAVDIHVGQRVIVDILTPLL